VHAACVPAVISYQPRRPAESPLYGIVVDHCEKFAAVYDDLYTDRYGRWRPEVADTFHRFLDCGVLAYGFLRVRCSACGHEVRVPWSCKKVGWCPSCGQRRSLEFAEFLEAELLDEVAYRHVVATVPRLLRPIFMRERALLGELGRCLWTAVCRGLREALGVKAATPGAVTGNATLGDSANPHPHIHGMFSAGAWNGRAEDAAFLPWPAELNEERLTELFRRLVLDMLVKRQRLSRSTAEKFLGWEHSGFSVFLGGPITPGNTESRRRLARYLVRAPLSLERLRYDASTCRVQYGSKKQGKQRDMSALDFLAEVSVAIPDRGQHLVSHWGRHSNRSRGERLAALATAAGDEAALPQGGGATSQTEDEPVLERKRKAFRIAWATLLRKVWDVDSMACPRCFSRMEIVAAITELSVVERILKHVGLFEKPRGPTIHECPTPPSGTDGQTLLVFPPRTLGVQFPATPAPTHSVEDPRLRDEWPTDPPFEDD